MLGLALITLVAALRAPDATTSLAFARAWAAGASDEAFARANDADADAPDAEALAAARGTSIEAGVVRRAPGADDGLGAGVVLAAAAPCVDPRPSRDVPREPTLSRDAPTRRRARLMVFLI